MAAQRTRRADPRGGIVELLSSSAEETQWWGEALGRLLGAGDVIALRGELGSGKTTLIQGIARGLTRSSEAVKSPTFVLMREYRGAIPVIHVDGYRLSGAPEAARLDEDLLFSPHKVTVIEWAERFEGLLPEDHLEVQLAHVSTNRRRICCTATGPRSTETLTQFSTVRREAEAPQAPPPAGSPDGAPRD